MARLVFTDFDEFADAVIGLNCRYIPTARSEADWWIEPMHVERLKLQQLQIGGAATFAGDGKEGELTLGIPITDPKAIRIDGHELSDGSYILLRCDQPLTYSAHEAIRLAGVTVPAHICAEPQFSDAAEWAAAMLSETRVQASASLLEPVRSVIARVCADDGVVSVVDPAASAAVEEEMLCAVSQLLRASTSTNDRHVGRPLVSRDRVIARCLELINYSEGQPMFISDLCRAAQVSERTLRNIFQEYFGVGPMRLLKVRQLREIRGALLAANPAEQTVTRIAARFGVWDFSLFARNYRALYGEAPSETLRGRHSSGADDVLMTPTWIGYAARRFAHGLVEPPAASVSTTGSLA